MNERLRTPLEAAQREVAMSIALGNPIAYIDAQIAQYAQELGVDPTEIHPQATGTKSKAVA